MQIILIDASFSYDEQTIIDKINLQISKNGIYTVIGSPKTGKTTLLKGISGILPSSSGTVLVGNFRPNSDVHQNLISFWGAKETFYPLMTGFEHITLLAKRKKRPIQTIFDVSNDLKMINYIDRPVKTYPKGIITRFDLALSFIDDKPLVLLDEPFKQIDEDSRVISQNFLKKMAQDKIIITTTTDVADIIDSQKVITLNKS